MGAHFYDFPIYNYNLSLVGSFLDEECRANYVWMFEGLVGKWFNWYDVQDFCGGAFREVPTIGVRAALLFSTSHMFIALGRQNLCPLERNFFRFKRLASASRVRCPLFDLTEFRRSFILQVSFQWERAVRRIRAYDFCLVSPFPLRRAFVCVVRYVKDGQLFCAGSRGGLPQERRVSPNGVFLAP